MTEKDGSTANPQGMAVLCVLCFTFADDHIAAEGLHVDAAAAVAADVVTVFHGGFKIRGKVAAHGSQGQRKAGILRQETDA